MAQHSVLRISVRIVFLLLQCVWVLSSIAVAICLTIYFGLNYHRNVIIVSKTNQAYREAQRKHYQIRRRDKNTSRNFPKLSKFNNKSYTLSMPNIESPHVPNVIPLKEPKSDHNKSLSTIGHEHDANNAANHHHSSLNTDTVGSDQVTVTTTKRKNENGHMH